MEEKENEGEEAKRKEEKETTMKGKMRKKRGMRLM